MNKTLDHLKIEATFTVLNDKGLHMRPSAELVKCAMNFKADITLIYKEHRVNAKSMLSILLLAAKRGAKIIVAAEGPEAKRAINAILRLASARFYIKY